MDIKSMAMSIPREDRPISNKKLSSVGDFFGLYGGEHIAATEFVIGSTLVTWGVKASDIFIGLIIGNMLATLSYTFLCAPIAVDTRLTLYSYLKKVTGPYMQKIYNFIFAIATGLSSASMLTVSASALRELFHIPNQTQWYPTDIKFIIVVLVIGTVVTVVAANGFESLAKFSSMCAPWMIVVFLSGALVSLPILIRMTNFSGIHSFSDFMQLLNTTVWTGKPVEGVEQFNIAHVIGFAWMCNLAAHAGLNDMALFRYAKNYKYGFISAVGMFIGHFFAWICAGIMGGTAALLLGVSLNNLDPGSVSSCILGGMGLFAVIVAGWTTANPGIYRAALALQTLFSKSTLKKVTYVLGAIATIVACFPIVSDIVSIINIIANTTPQVGAIVLVEHWLFPKIKYTRYWAKYKNMKLNYAALLAWITSVVTAILLKKFNVIYSQWIFLPTFIVAGITYIIYAGFMGAKDKYTEEEKLQNEIDKEVLRIVDEEAEKEEVEQEHLNILSSQIAKAISLIILCGIVVLSLMAYNNKIELESYKVYSVICTILYFITGGFSVIIKNRKVKMVADVEVAADKNQ